MGMPLSREKVFSNALLCSFEMSSSFAPMAIWAVMKAVRVSMSLTMSSKTDIFENKADAADARRLSLHEMKNRLEPKTTIYGDGGDEADCDGTDTDGDAYDDGDDGDDDDDNNGDNHVPPPDGPAWPRGLW